MPVGLGNEVILRYISIALGREGGRDSGMSGVVPKRKVRAIGPSRPKGLMAKGRSAMLLRSRSPMISSPQIGVPVVGSCLLPRHNLCFSKT